MAVWARCLVLVALLAACSSKGSVRLAGQFSHEAPPPGEVRVMLDPHYGNPKAKKMDAFELQEVRKAASFESVSPEDGGAFSTRPLAVTYPKTEFGAPPPPTFFVSFANERDVFYAVGRRHAVFQYRTYDVATKEPVSRADACWKVTRGEFSKAKGNETVLSIFVAPNFDSPKLCLPEGTFTPSRLESDAALGE